MDLSNIKAVISEVDGIVTEHLSGIGEMNITMFKQFYMKDFEAINLIKKNWLFVFISSDASITMSLCRKRNIPFFHAEKDKKEVFVNNVLRKYSLAPDSILYIGNSYSDIECLRMSAVSMCPDDAVIPVKNVVDCVIPMLGGTGILCYVYDVLYSDMLLRMRNE